MIYRFVFSLIALLPFAAAQVQLQFGPGLTNSRVLQLPNGDQLLVGTNQANSHPGSVSAAIRTRRSPWPLWAALRSVGGPGL